MGRAMLSSYPVAAECRLTRRYLNGRWDRGGLGVGPRRAKGPRTASPQAQYHQPIFPFSVVLSCAGVACILFGIRYALNLGGAADRTAALHRQIGNTRVRRWPPSKLHNHRPLTTIGMRLAGGLFVLVGVMFILIGVLLASFPDT